RFLRRGGESMVRNSPTFLQSFPGDARPHAGWPASSMHILRSYAFMPSKNCIRLLPARQDGLTTAVTSRCCKDWVPVMRLQETCINRSSIVRLQETFGDSFRVAVVIRDPVKRLLSQISLFERFDYDMQSGLD